VGETNGAACRPGCDMRKKQAVLAMAIVANVLSFPFSLYFWFLAVILLPTSPCFSPFSHQCITCSNATLSFLLRAFRRTCRPLSAAGTGHGSASFPRYKEILSNTSHPIAALPLPTGTLHQRSRSSFLRCKRHHLWGPRRIGGTRRRRAPGTAVRPLQFRRLHRSRRCKRRATR